MTLLPFQREDLARAACHDGLILSWDTGLGKGIAAFFWPLLKVGWTTVPADAARPLDPCKRLHGPRLVPEAPVLLVAPGDLHRQLIDEAADKFGAEVYPLDHQDTFARLVRAKTADGRPVIPPAFYLTTYTQLCTNGLQRLPDANALAPRALLAALHRQIGPDDPPATELAVHWKRGLEGDPPATVTEYFACRAQLWRDAYAAFDLDPGTATREQAQAAHAAAVARLHQSNLADPRYLAKQQARYDDYLAVLEHLCWPAANVPAGDAPASALLSALAAGRPRGPFHQLTHAQQDWVIREFGRAHLERAAQGIHQRHSYDLPGGVPGPDGKLPQFHIQCLLSPTLSDLCHRAFACVVVDEGVRMKSDDTHLGRGLRQMDPPYRLVLTATPAKNRLPDIFWLAWWATGGKAEPHARWPYPDTVAAHEEFARTFMVSECNLTAAQQAAAQGKSYRIKRSAEVCQIHRLWKLLAPVHLRRRKDDTGLNVQTKIRRVVRVVPGAEQRRVYQYHLDAEYLDINQKPALGAQLQALRIAAADASSPLLEPVPGGAYEPCPACADESRFPTSSGGSGTCPRCHGARKIALPHRATSPYNPKLQATLTLIAEILERREQVVVFAAFNHPLDTLAQRLTESHIRHVLLDGRTSQKKRGLAAARFKAGRPAESDAPVDASSPDFDPGIPVMLAGVESMSEGHSFHRANNVILIAYSWAYDKFIQAINRVHRINSTRPINVYVVLVDGTIDARLESLIQEKSDAAELVLDGRLIGERSEEVSLAELLQVARASFGQDLRTLDETALERAWPDLRRRLGAAGQGWDALPGRPTVAAPTVAPAAARRIPVACPPAVARPVAIRHPARPATPGEPAWAATLRAALAARRAESLAL
jgi:hypothetical protein